MSSIRRTTPRRWYLSLTALLVFAAMTAGLVGVAGAAQPTLTAAGTGPGAAKPMSHGQADRTPGFVLNRGTYFPVATPPGLEHVVAGPLGPVGLNDRDQVTGRYLDPTGRERGFLLDRNRNTFIQVDVPGAVGTQGQGINNRGEVVGAYSDTGPTSLTGAQLRGFVLDHGRYIRLDYPGALSSQASDINERGQVVGEYRATDGSYHGYLWQRGRFQSLPTPGGATGINNRGQITGTDAATSDGYLLAGERLTTFEAPGAQITVPFDINDRGQIVGVGTASMTATTGSGFLLGGGRFTVIERPDAVLTAAFAINNRGQIAGVAPTAADLANLPGTAMTP